MFFVETENTENGVSAPTLSGETFSHIASVNMGGKTAPVEMDIWGMTASTSHSGSTVSWTAQAACVYELDAYSGASGYGASATGASDPTGGNTSFSINVTTDAAKEMQVSYCCLQSSSVDQTANETTSSGTAFTLNTGVTGASSPTLSMRGAYLQLANTSGSTATAVWSMPKAFNCGVSVMLKPAPAPSPTSLSATPGNGQVDLSWTGSSLAASYNVYRATASGSETLYQPGVTGTNYADAGVTAGTTYYYEVTAVNVTGESGKSNEVSAAPLPPNFTLSASPGSLTVQQGANGSSTITASPVSGFTGSVTLSLVSPPSGITGTFSPVSVSISGSSTSTLTISPDYTVAQGNYTLTVQGVSGSITQSTTVELTVTPGVPSAPIDLTANGGSAQVSLSWGAPANGTAASYNLYRGITSDGEGTTPYKTGISGTNYTDSGLSSGTTYYYQVTAVNSVGEGPKSNEASAITAPSAPTALTATAGNAQVSLSWTASSGAANYIVYRGTTSGGENSTPIATDVTSANYTDKSASNGTTYYYDVTAVNSGGESGKSNEVSATPMPPPSAPANLTATAGNAQVSLSWTASSGATGYNIYRGITSGGESATPVATDTSATNYTDPGLTNGTTYYYKVTAVDSFGEGQPSNEAYATPSAPVLTSITIAPSSALVSLGTTQQFTATALDQFGEPLSTQPQFTWSLEANSEGTIDQTGLYTAGNQIGSDTVQAQSGSVSGTVSAIDILAPPNPPSGGDSPQARAKISRGLQPMDSSPVTIPSGLQMISVPYSYSSDTLDQIFNYSDTVIATWSPSEDQYTLPQSISPGWGYWSNFPDGTTVTTGNAVNTQQSFTIQLPSTWSMIGDPFLSNIAVSACTFNNLTCAQAIQQGVINGAIYTYNNGTGAYQQTSAVSATLDPGVGYWIYVAPNHGTVNMAFPGPDAPPSTPQPTANPNPISGFGQLTTTLSANSNDASGGTDLIYTWSASPSTGVVFGGTNDSNAAATIQATVPQTGTYIFTVEAELNDGSGTESSGNVTVIAQSAAPTNLKAIAGNAQVQLSWTATNGATSYNVYRGTSSGGESATPIATSITTTSYTDTGLTNGTKYYYEVAAVDNGKTSGMSNETSATPYSALQPVLEIDCGSNSAFIIPDTIDNIVPGETTFSADTDYSSGSALPTSQPIAWADDQGGNDYPLLQAQRVGQSFTYSLPLPNGSYELGLYFADIQNSSLGQNVFNVTVNGVAVLQNFDIIRQAQSQYGGSGQYDGIEEFIPFYVFDNNTGSKNTTIAFTAATGVAAVAGISISKYTDIQPEQRIGAVGGGVIQDIPTPGWAQSGEPDDSMSSGGAGPSSSESVSLSAGIEQNDPGPDIWAFNPTGPSVTYEREYRSSVAAAYYYSAGLTPGWTDNFDFAIVSQQPYQWGALTLYYPDGASDTIQPGSGRDSNGAPTSLIAPTGAPYLVTGTPKLPSNSSSLSTVGEWQSFQITMGDQSVWTFEPDPASFFQPYCMLYYLTSITNALGQTININRSGDPTVPFELDHITSITDGYGNALLSFQYNPADGTLQSVTDNNNRTVSYSYASATGPYGSFNALQSVSVIDSATTALWQYGYDPTTGYLNSAETLDPNGSGSYNGYQTQFDGDGRVASHIDANDNVSTYNYADASSGETGITSATQSEITGGTNDLAWTQYFNTNLNHMNTGNQNPSGRISLEYGDGNNPFAATQVTDQMGFETVLGYADRYGHIQTTTPPGGPTSTSSYLQVGLNNGNTNQPVVTPSITDLPGTVTVNDSSGHQITPVQLTYLQNGLVYQAKWPEPGQPYATQFEMATYSYDNLGDVTQITEPGPNGTTTISLDYLNGYNGYNRTQPVIGEPLTVKVSGPSSDETTTTQYTHYKYDSLGDTTAVIDGLGDETDYQYNIAGQLTEIIEPPAPTGQTVTIDGQQQYQTYQTTITYTPAYLGGPVDSTVLSGNGLTEQVNYKYGPEGELLSVSGDTLPATYGYDSLYRLTSITDGDGNETRYYYDTSGNLQYVKYPDGKEEQYSYNPDGTLYQYTDCNGITRTYIRNPQGNPNNAIVDPNEVWKVTYSSGLNPIYYDYDSFERISSISSADSGTTTYTLDDLGNATQVADYINGLGKTYTTSYNYNPDGTISSSTYGSYSYDGLGRLVTQYPGIGVVNVSGQWTSPPGQPDHDTFRYSYYSNGWLEEADTWIGAPVSYPNGNDYPQIQTNYQYDQRGLLTTLCNTANAYNVPNAQSQTSNLNVVLSTYGDEELNQTSYHGLAPIMTYDAAGNRLQEVSFINPLGNNSSYNGALDSYNAQIPPDLTGVVIFPHDIDYGYDKRNELISESYSTPNVSIINPPLSATPIGSNDDYNYAFGYDGYTGGNYTAITGVGNLTTFRSDTYSGSPYNSDNQLSISGLGYDSNGNTTDFGGLTATYDPEDRLTSMPYTYNGQNGTFGAGYYASTGLRQYKDGVNGRTYYVYDGDDPVEELDSNGNLIATNVYGPTGLIARYYPGVFDANEGQAGSEYLGNTIYYTYDPQGNVVQRLVSEISGYAPDGNGAEFQPNGVVPLDSENYDAFGEQHWDVDLWSGQQEAYQDPFGYGAQWGYYTDNETGLVLMGHRYYAYGNGHFLTRDPTGYAGGINLYGFVGNNPITRTDPSGFDMTGQMKDQETIALDRLDGMTSKEIRHQLLYAKYSGTLYKLHVAEKVLKPAAEASTWVLAGLSMTVGAFEDEPILTNVDALGDAAGDAGAAAGKKAAEEAAQADAASIPIYHYTTDQGLSGILKDQAILPSLEGGADARYGSGQYFTDLAPGSMTRGQIARRIYGQPWAGNRLNNVIILDSNGLSLVNPAPNIFLNPSTEPLSVTGRIIYAGPNPK